MSKADQIRQAYAQPAVRARIDQDAAAERDRASGKIVSKVRKMAGASEGAALIREMLPAYLASRARGR